MARVLQVGGDALGGTFEPIPVGTKLAVAVFEIEETVTGPNSKNPGAPQFVFTAKVVEEGPYKGREIKFNYISLDPNAAGAWALAAFAEAVGWPTERVTDPVTGKVTGNISIPDDLRDVLGTVFLAKMGQTASQKINPADGKPYMNNRVTGYAKLKEGGATPTPPTEDKKWGEV